MTINTISTRDSALRQYIDSTGELPPDVLLGRIVLYTITDEPVAHADLQRWFKELGLDEHMLPFPIKDVDAFKKATSAIDGHRYPLSKGGRMAHLLCRDVTSTPDYIRRWITREVQDPDRKRLFYDQALEITYFRKRSKAGASAMNLKINRAGVLREELDNLREVQDAIAESFAHLREFHDGQKLRTLVRNYLKHINSIEIKGGVYFTHSTRDAELSALTELVNRFGGGCSMNTLPMVDLAGQREFIAGVFEREAAQRLEEITRDVSAAITAPTVTGAAFAKLRERYDEVLRNATEHMLNLQVTQDLTAASAEVAQDALSRLQEKMIA